MVRVGHPFTICIKTGARRDGTLVAREVEATLDGGAFADDSPGVLSFCLRMSCGPYRYDAATASGVVAYTNKLRSGAFRGFGQPQMQFGGEQQIDEIARRLGLDPIAVRRKNALVPGERWFGGQEVASNGLAECLDKIEAASGWKHRAALPSRLGKRRGLGLACSAHISALLSTGAIVRMLEDGSIVPNTGATDIGQGSDTILAQICAEALQVDPSYVVVASPDTTAHHTTGAQPQAASPIRLALRRRRCRRWCGRPSSTPAICSNARSTISSCVGGRMGVKGARARNHVPNIAARTLGSGRTDHRQSQLAIQAGHGRSETRHRGWQCCALRRLQLQRHDRRCRSRRGVGQIDVLRTWSQSMSGSHNPVCVEGQIEGAFVQGMGFAHRGSRGIPGGEQSIADGLQGSDQPGRPVRDHAVYRRGAGARRSVRCQRSGRDRNECRSRRHCECCHRGDGLPLQPASAHARARVARHFGK